MSLHQLKTITIGVPNLEEVASYYAEFGLERIEGNRFLTRDAGEQLRLRSAPVRQLLDLTIGVDDADDLARTAANLQRFDTPVELSATRLETRIPGTSIRVALEVAPRLVQPFRAAEAVNGPGRSERSNLRAAAVLRESGVAPRKLGHVVIGTPEHGAVTDFMVRGIGFKVSDSTPATAFLRCSTDHHNMLIVPGPLTFLHHTSWQVDDIDEVGRGAATMLRRDPARHVWGLGRHHIGSNFFWYLRDPAGNFSEYYSDLDCIVDDDAWRPEVFEDAKGLFNWGPPPPASFLAPDDLAEMMISAHA